MGFLLEGSDAHALSVSEILEKIVRAAGWLIAWIQWRGYTAEP
jgi:hypothetical protein